MSTSDCSMGAFTSEVLSRLRRTTPRCQRVNLEQRLNKQHPFNDPLRESHDQQSQLRLSTPFSLPLQAFTFESCALAIEYKSRQE